MGFLWESFSGRMGDLIRSFSLEGGKESGKEIREETFVSFWRKKNELGKWLLDGSDVCGDKILERVSWYDTKSLNDGVRERKRGIK
jgi:hypothetical protein